MRGQAKLSSGDRMRRLEGRYLQYAAYGFLLLFCFILQMTPSLLPTIAGGRPLLLIPAVVCIGMFTDPVTGGVCGAISGFVWDMFSDRLVGQNALYLLAVGALCGLLIQFLMRNNVLSALLMGGVAALLQMMGEWLFTYVLWKHTGSVEMLLYRLLPGVVYTVGLILPIYYVTLRVAKSLKKSR